MVGKNGRWKAILWPRTLNKIFALYEADPTDLVFYLRDGNEVNEDEAGTRYELRRKYWTYALDYIHTAHGDVPYLK